MKISKLFHWLYALVMFLPILMFIPNVLYYGFNEHATNNDTYEIIYKYESNEVNGSNDLVKGNIYNINLNDVVSSDILSNENSYIDLVILKTNSIDFGNLTDTSLDTWNNVLSGSSEPYIDLYISYGSFDIFVYLNQDDDVYADFYYADPVTESFSFNGVVLLNDYLDLEEPHIFEYTSYNEISSVQNNDDTITNKMYQGWQQVWDLPLFTWSHSTYFSAPFTYISVLFGWQANNSISYCLSYWFTISIIWLVFDVMLYVPLLVHRWLDKASIS